MSGRPHPGRFRLAALAALALALVAVLAGCGVTTTVGVRVAANGTGAVTVQVSLDRQAVAEVGGLSNQLRTSDLVAAGWAVKGPARGPSGSQTVTVTHPFAHLSQVPTILAEVASPGSTPGAPVPFVLHVVRSGPADRSTTTATGTVDLRCGLSCFGDAGLQKAYGSDVGVNASGFEGAAGMAAARRDFVFHFTVSVPGRVTSSNAASRDGATLGWVPQLGGIDRMRASSVVVIAAPKPLPAPASGGARGAGAIVIVLVVALVLAAAFAWRRLRRRRGAHSATT